MTRRQKYGRGFSLIELMVVVTLIGILTTVAVPILAKQLLRAKTVEAYEALSKIRDGAKAYYVHTHWDKNGNVLPYGFPTNVTMIPHDGPKCDRVSTPHKVWDKAGWHSLSFAFVDYHYFAYTWGMEMDLDTPIEVTGAQLKFKSIRNWTWEPNKLYVNLLDEAPLGVTKDRDNQAAGNYFAGQGILLQVV